MKRNMDLIRQLAIRIELADNQLDVGDILIETFSPEEILYHCGLMREAGLIVGQIVALPDGVGYGMISHLTWPGHDFLDAARDDKLWNRTMKTVGERVSSVTFDSLLDLLKAGALALIS